MTKIEIRPARPDDADGMSAVLKAIIDLTGRQRAFDAAHVREIYIDNPRRIACSVATIEGDIVGFQSLTIAHADNIYGVTPGWGIIGTHISPKAFRKGVGKALFAVSREAALDAGLTDIDASIMADNDMGLAYYDAIGFRSYRTTDTRICKRYRLV